MKSTISQKDLEKIAEQVIGKEEHFPRYVGFGIYEVAKGAYINQKAFDELKDKIKADMAKKDFIIFLKNYAGFVDKVTGQEITVTDEFIERIFATCKGVLMKNTTDLEYDIHVDLAEESLSRRGEMIYDMLKKRYVADCSNLSEEEIQELIKEGAIEELKQRSIWMDDMEEERKEKKQ